jgi:hypothetical protein
MRAWLYELMPFLSRWSNAAPAACCGVCRACAVSTAGNLAAIAGGIALEAVGIRRELASGDEPFAARDEPVEADDERPAPIELPMAR